MKQTKVILILLVVFLLFPVSAFAEKPIEVFLNGEKLSFPVDPIVKNETTLVPFRVIFEKLGLSVGWDQATQTVTGAKEGLSISFRIGEKNVTVNDEPMEFAVPSQVINGTTLVPLRFISEVAGKEVIWDGPTKSIFINDISFLMDGEPVLATESEKILKKYLQFDVQSVEYFLDFKAFNEYRSFKRPLMELQSIGIATYSPFEVSHHKGELTVYFFGFGETVDVEIFLIDNNEYLKIVETGEWIHDEKGIISTEEIDFDFNEYINSDHMQFIEKVESKLVGKYIDLRIKYNVNRLNQIVKEQGEQVELVSYEEQILIDPTTWYPKQTNTWLTIQDVDQTEKVIIEAKLEFISYNKIENITIPEDLQEMIYK